MSKLEKMPEPCANQLEIHRDIKEAEGDRVLNIHLHKLKFHHQKALDEFESDEPLENRLPNDVYGRSEGILQARSEAGTQVSAEEAWYNIGTEERWVGAIPIQIYREQLDVHLRGFPYLIGFKNGEPRVILNKILPSEEANLERFYANEWARPWVIAEMLDATGFNTDNVVVATMKAFEDRETTEEDSVLSYLNSTARENVNSMLELGVESDLTPWEPVEPEIPHQSDFVRTQLIGYRSEYNLFRRLGHGLSIRDAIQVFSGSREPNSSSPPDRGQPLDYAVGPPQK
jgi:hypothetical protein